VAETLHVVCHRLLEHIQARLLRLPAHPQHVQIAMELLRLVLLSSIERSDIVPCDGFMAGGAGGKRCKCPDFPETGASGQCRHQQGGEDPWDREPETRIHVSRIFWLESIHHPKSGSWTGGVCGFWGAGKAQRREMVRPRRAEQCLPQEGATPQRNAGTMKCGRGIPCAARSPLRGTPSCDAPGRPISRRCEQRCHAP